MGSETHYEDLTINDDAAATLILEFSHRLIAALKSGDKTAVGEYAKIIKKLEVEFPKAGKYVDLHWGSDK